MTHFSDVKRLITINRIQNKKLRIVYIIYVYTVYILMYM